MIPSSPSSVAEAPAALRRPRVLVVKDSRPQKRTYHLSLRDKGFEVNTVPHGPEAMKALASGEHDLLIVESGPRGEGYCLLDMLRKYLLRANLPVVAMTVPAGPGSQELSDERCREYGVVRTFSLGTNKAGDVVSAVRKVLGVDPPRLPRFYLPTADGAPAPAVARPAAVA